MYRHGGAWLGPTQLAQYAGVSFRVTSNFPLCLIMKLQVTSTLIAPFQSLCMP